MMMRKLRVLHIVASSRGGAAEHVFSIAKGIDRSQFDLTVIMPEDDGNVVASDFESYGVRFVPSNLFNRPSLREVLNLRDFIREGDFDIVHFHGTRAAMVGRLAMIGLRHRPKIVYTIHGLHMVHYRNPIKRICMMLLERLLNRSTDAIICVSYGDRERVIRSQLASEDKVRVIWNGIDIRKFENVNPSPLLKGELGLPSGARVITMIGRLHPPKDFFTLITAFKHIQAEVPHVHLLIVGDGPQREELKKHAKDLEVDSKITFAGLRKDIPQILAITDIFVLSTLWEGLPLVLLEAMAAAKPVVATDVPGNREVVVHGETGLLFPVRNSKALAEAVIQLARNPRLAKVMGEKGLARVKDNFSLEKMVQSTTDLYRGLLE